MDYCKKKSGYAEALCKTETSFMQSLCFNIEASEASHRQKEARKAALGWPGQ